MLKNLFFLLILSGMMLSLKAQKISLYPDQMQVLASHNSAFNPSYITEDSAKYTALFATKINQRSLGNVGLQNLEGGLYFLNGNKRQALRVQFYNEQEGPYLSRNRGYFNYALQLPLGDELSISSGASFGFSSSTVDAVTTSAYANFMVPDANWGIMLKYRKFQLGGSIYQMFNNAVNSSSDLVILGRYYHAQLEYSFDINSMWNLKYASWARFFATLDTQWSNNVEMLYRSCFGAGVVHTNVRGLSFYVSAKSQKSRRNLSFLLAYNSRFGAITSGGYESLELSISMLIR